MDQFVYVAYMIYAILSVLVVAFVVYILPSLVVTICETLVMFWEYLIETEWVERLLLAVEEVREWHTEPGKHRPRRDHGIDRSDDTYFSDLAKMWKEVEDTLRVDLDKKEKVNA